MAAPIEPLVALQEVDSEFRKLREEVDVLGRAAEETRAEVELLRAELATRRAELENVERRRRDVEAQLKDEEERTKTHRMRIERVRNERELTALRREVDRGKELAGLLEEEVLQLYETTETKSVEVKTLEEELAGGEKVLAERDAALAERHEALRAQLEEVAARREKLAAEVDGSLLGRYESVLQRTRGLAVVAVTDGNCAGCGLRVPPQLITQIHRKADVVVCPTCHRMLYVR